MVEQKEPTFEEVMALPNTKCPVCGEDEFVRVEKYKIDEKKDGFAFIPYTNVIRCFNCKEAVDVLKVAKKLKASGGNGKL